MKVIIIREENHGIIGAARCNGDKATWAVNFLIAKFWLSSHTDIYVLDGPNWGFHEVCEVYGENWAEFMRNLTIDQFNKIWDGLFYLEEWEVFGIDNVTIW